MHPCPTNAAQALSSLKAKPPAPKVLSLTGLHIKLWREGTLVKVRAFWCPAASSSLRHWLSGLHSRCGSSAALAALLACGAHLKVAALPSCAPAGSDSQY